MQEGLGLTASLDNDRKGSKTRCPGPPPAADFGRPRGGTASMSENLPEWFSSRCETRSSGWGLYGVELLYDLLLYVDVLAPGLEGLTVLTIQLPSRVLQRPQQRRVRRTLLSTTASGERLMVTCRETFVRVDDGSA